jgi:hypothetical protein
MSFEDANTQAKSKFLTFLGITNSFNVDFEKSTLFRTLPLMSMLIHLGYPGSATIENYEDNLETPTLTKNITWESAE